MQLVSRSNKYYHIMKHLLKFESFANGIDLQNTGSNFNSSVVKNIKNDEEFEKENKTEETLWTLRVRNWCQNNNINYKNLTRSQIANILSKTGSPENDFVIAKVFDEITK